MSKRPVFWPEFGKFFREVREAKGWGQRQAAGFAHQRKLKPVTHNVLLRLEHGRIKNPEPELLRALASLYGEPYERLVATCVYYQYGLVVRPTSENLDESAHVRAERPRSELPDKEMLSTLSAADPDDDVHGQGTAVHPGTLAPSLRELLVSASVAISQTLKLDTELGATVPRRATTTTRRDGPRRTRRR